MTQAKSDKAGAASADAFEAEIRANARPMLNPEERKEAARKKAALQASWAAAKARDAAAAQLAKAEAYEAEAASFEGA